MSKIIKFNVESREALKRGIDILADAVKVTLGPKGRNVIIEKTYGAPHVTKDGVSVAKEVELEDPIENMGAQLIREAASKTCDNAGDGTTTATILAQAMINNGVKYLAAGANPIGIKRGMDKATAAIVQEIKRMAVPIDDTYANIENVATISANNDPEIGKLIADAIKIVKKDGVITIEESKSAETTIEVVEGLQIDRGYLSPYFVTDQDQMTCEFNNCNILLLDRKLDSLKSILEVLEESIQKDRPLLIIAEDFDAEVLSTLVVNRLRGGFKICAIKSPGFGDKRKELLHDLAAATGATVIVNSEESINFSVMGGAEKVTVTRDRTTIINGMGTKEAVSNRINNLKEQLATAKDPEFIKERIARLSTGVAVIYVGAPSEIEMKEKKDRVDDALCATRAALEEGIVPGGGVALIRAERGLYSLVLPDEDEQLGKNIIKKALECPLIEIANNAGQSGVIIVDQVADGDDDWGYNAKTNEFTNLYEAGIVDPAKVTRVALENATSVASMFLTTECVIARKPENQIV